MEALAKSKCFRRGGGFEWRLAGIIMPVVFFMVISPSNLYAQTHGRWLSAEPTLTFDRFSVDQGLSQSLVRCIWQDRQGFMWFGTEDGLNKYDGYGFKHFKHDPENPNSLSHNFILTISEDRTGLLWIGTWGGGLNRFDPVTEQFTRYRHDPDNPGSLSHNTVFSIYEDSRNSGALWVGTIGGGLNRFDFRTGQFSHYRHDAENPNSLSHDAVNDICQDQTGALWIGTANGLDKFVPATSGSSGGENDGPPAIFTHFHHDPNNPQSLSTGPVSAVHLDREGVLWAGVVGGGLERLVAETGEFVHYRQNPGDPYSLSDNSVDQVYEDHSGVLWIGTVDRGLNRFDRAREQFVRYLHQPNDNHSLSHNFVMAIHEDRVGALWVGTFSGLNRSRLDKKPFLHYRHNPDNANSLSGNTVWSILQDREGLLWIGTNLGGLNRFDREKNQFTRFQHQPENPRSLGHNTVRTICEDRQGDLWLATDAGLDKYDRRWQRFDHYRHDPKDPHSLSHNFVWTIYEDHAGALWIGTNGGLNRFDHKQQRFEHYRHDPNDSLSLSQNSIWCITEDQGGALWVGTMSRGLNRLNRERTQFTRFQNELRNPKSLSDNRVLSVYVDRRGTLWAGTGTAGLNKFDRDTEMFTHYREKDGLPNDVVYGILEDQRGNLWLITNKGLAKFNPATGQFRNYDVSDGLQSNEFNIGAYHKSKNGEMFFGGINGFNAFYPEDIKDNPHAPPVLITDFQLFNKSVPIGKSADGRVLLQKSITTTDAIKLSYKDNVFSFGFVALNFANPEKNQYQYKMEGFDADWTAAGTRRFATYTNLDPGEYTFRVKGSNNDGIWNERGAALKIIITPPYWQTWWFRAGASITILLLAFIWYRRRITHIEARKKELEIQVEERTRAAEALGNALAEVERLKNRLQAENIYLQDEIKVVHNFENIITRSAALTKVLRNVEQVASSDATVLILGESGTGKELVARAVHRISPRSNRPLVKVNCSALPANLIESELFGHEKGAYTGAVARKIGRFELADGGTIFLDEIGDLPLELQTKLLRVLQEGEFERLGDPQTVKVDVRVIAATNRDLEKERAQGNFREDLFYRLNVFPIQIPPLRERKEDIPLLINHFVKKYSAKIGRKIESIPQEVLDRLLAYHWPGNVRELENLIERALIISPGPKLMLGDWLPKTDSSPAATTICTLEETERHHILSALEKTNWRVSGEKGAAKILGINPKTLESRMKKLEIRRKRLTSDAVRNS